MMLIFLLFPSKDTSTIQYLYTRLKFDWTEQQYTLWSSAGTLVSTLASVGFVWLCSHKFKVRTALSYYSFKHYQHKIGSSFDSQFHDCLIGLCGAISGITVNVVMAFVTQSWMLYMGMFYKHSNIYWPQWLSLIHI